MLKCGQGQREESGGTQKGRQARPEGDTDSGLGLGSADSFLALGWVWYPRTWSASPSLCVHGLSRRDSEISPERGRLNLGRSLLHEDNLILSSSGAGPRDNKERR